MTSLLENFNNLREEFLQKYYNDVITNLIEKIKLKPFDTEFIINFDYLPSEIINELIYRFNQQNIEAKVNKSLINSKSSIIIKIKLPSYLTSNSNNEISNDIKMSLSSLDEKLKEIKNLSASYREDNEEWPQEENHNDTLPTQEIITG